MLNQDQINAFRLAVAFHNNCGNEADVDDTISNESDVIVTAEAISSVLSGMVNGGVRRSNDINAETPFGTLSIFDNVQKTRGQPRETMYAMDFGNASALYFI